MNCKLFGFLLVVLFPIYSWSQNLVEEEVLVITYGMEQINEQEEQEHLERMKTQLQPFFKAVKCKYLIDERRIDSIYAVTEKVIILQSRWYKTISGNCWGDCDDNGRWILNKRISIKNGIEKQFFLGKFNWNQSLAESLYHFYSNIEKKSLAPNPKIHMIYSRRDDRQLNYFETLQKEFGVENVIKLTFANIKKMAKVEYDYLRVIFTYLPNNLVADFVHPKNGQIVKSVIVE